MDTYMNNVIYTAIDKNYEGYATACFNSIEQNYPDHPLVLIYANDLSEQFTEYVSSLNNFQIKSYEWMPPFKKLGPVNNEIVYLKYLLWSDEFDEYDNVLHLDCDTLILQPLDQLFEGDEFLIFDNNEHGSFRMFTEIYPDELKVPTEVLGNAGIFMVPKRYRTPENLAELIQLTTDYEDHMLYADQSVINVWCHVHGITVSTDHSFNFQPQFMYNKDNTLTLDDVKILHFAAKKPDTIEFALWWRVGNGLSMLLNKMYNNYLKS